MAATLESVGVNLDFAPVVDLNINPDNPIIGAIGRSFSSDPAVRSWSAAIVLSQKRCPAGKDRRCAGYLPLGVSESRGFP